MSLRRYVLWVTLIAAVVGCANVKVRKVETAKRATGKDDHVKGFRYYLTRPYVVVSDRIPLGTDYLPALPALYDFRAADGTFLKTDIVMASLVPYGENQHLIFDRDGNQVGQAQLRNLRPITIKPVGGEEVQPPEATVDEAKLQELEIELIIKNLQLKSGLTFTSSEITALRMAMKTVLPDDAILNAVDRHKRLVLDMLKKLTPAGAQGLTATSPAAQATGESVNRAFYDSNLPSWQLLIARSIAADVFESLVAMQQAGQPPPIPADFLQVRALIENDNTDIASATTVDQVIDLAVGRYQQAMPAIIDATRATAMQAQFKAALKAFTPPAGAGAALPPVALLPEPQGPTFTTFAKAGEEAPETPEKPAQPAPGSIQVIFLPDFEEQYAISNCNFMAKSHYKYKFHNGTELASVSGSYNSTDVPVKIVETIGTLIDAAKDVALASMGNPAAAAGAGSNLSKGIAGAPQLFYIETQYYIEPGVYRLQKSWERTVGAAAGAENVGQMCGMFADLGLKVVPAVSVLTEDEYTKKFPKPAE